MSWQKENIEAYRKYQREYHSKYRKTQEFKDKRNKRLKEDPVFRSKEKVRQAIKSAFKRKGFKKTLKSEQILGCSISEFKEYIATKFQPGMTWDNHGEWHLDHVVPIAVASTTEEITKLNHFSNFQPLWSVDNLTKSSKI